VIADTGVVVAHSDRRFAEKPVKDVDPELGPEMLQITAPVARVEGAAGKDRRYVFASPVVALGKRQGTLVLVYSLKGLDSDLARIESEKVAASRANVFRTFIMGLVFVLVGTALAIWQGLRITQPIKLLALRADQIAHGDLNARAEVNSSDEIGMQR